MKKFNLLQILPALNSGGVEQGTIDVANKIAEENNKNTIISNGGAMLKFLNKKYVTHYTLPVHSKNFLKTPFIAHKINKIIKENNINILHVRSRAPAWLLPFINKKNITTVSTFHNVYGNQNYFKKFYNKGLSKTDYIVAISNYVKEEIINKYNLSSKKITVINRGVDTDFFDTRINDENKFLKFLQKNKLTNHKKNILFPGRLTKWKGQIEFLKIFENLNNKNIMLYFIGDTKNYNYTKKLIKEINKRDLNHCCKVLGHFKKDDLKMMYKISDLVISAPLKPEGFGRIISEALAMKKIILAYNFGGVKNQLEGLSEIYKITPKNEKEFIKKISFILDNNDEYKEIKDIGREHIIKNFSKKNMLENYINLYTRITT